MFFLMFFFEFLSLLQLSLLSRKDVDVPDANVSLFNSGLLSFTGIWLSHSEIHSSDSIMLLHILAELGAPYTV